MKTLVIHPTDSTTDFLKNIYSERGWTVINTNPSTKLLKQQIKDHDRIIMLGHGSDKGLFGFNRMLIDSTLVYLLREKICVCVWCNADKFVENYKLKGFYTGMIISEYEEALMYCVKASIDTLDESNILLANVIRYAIESKDILLEAKLRYTSKTNYVIMFNEQNLFHTS